MKYFCAKAKCQECRLAFRYAFTEEDIEDESAHDVSCPRCGELVDIPISSHSPCTEETYEEITEEYEELEDQFGLEDGDDEEEDEEDEWE